MLNVIDIVNHKNQILLKKIYGKGQILILNRSFEIAVIFIDAK
jgi:hypothetical protein